MIESYVCNKTAMVITKFNTSSRGSKVFITSTTTTVTLITETAHAHASKLPAACTKNLTCSSYM